MKKALPLIIIGIIIIVVVVLLSMSPDNPARQPDFADLAEEAQEEMMQETHSPEVMEEETMIEEDETSQTPVLQPMDPIMPWNGELLAGTSDLPLLDFEQSDYEYALANNKKIAFLFFADWCPTCRNEIKNAVIPAFSELENDDLVTFLVNIEDRNTDKFEEALQREFQVLGRHVKVFVGQDGEVIQKSAPENWTTDRYVEELGAL